MAENTLCPWSRVTYLFGTTRGYLKDIAYPFPRLSMNFLFYAENFVAMASSPLQ
jgi:hypothetical protein